MTEKNYPHAISYSHAIKIVQQQAGKHTLNTEEISINQAFNRVLANNVTSSIDVPIFDCSRMDGYAIKYDDYSQNQLGTFKLSEPKFAGDDNSAINQTADEPVAVPIMTGALLPEGTDTVVMKEHVSQEARGIRLTHPVRKAQHIRKAGSDIKQGQVLLKRNHKISIADLGLLASVGLHQVKLYKKPQVALMMTGNELVNPGDVEPGNLPAGKTYDSISLMLKELLVQMGCEVSLLPVLADDSEKVAICMSEIAQQNHDLVVTVGGVSMGDRDLLPKILEKEGQISFHKCLVKPGFPLLFGKLGPSLFFGLPGNPVSAFVTCFEFIYPALLVMLKTENQTPVSWRAEILHDLNKPHMKREFVRGYYTVNANGHIEVMVCGDQQSSRVKSLSEANCFIVMNESQLEIKRGQSVIIQPFNQTT